MTNQPKKTGRPPEGDAPRDKVLPPVRVTAEELAAYRAKCERTGKSLSKVIRDYLNRWSRTK